MSKVRLTIGIPVYNGARFIQQTLDSILTQLSCSNSNKVEILVSDNASEDNTSIIVHEYKEKHNNIIKYFCNDKNVGYDKNVDLVVTMAEGTYVWLLGCGEVIKKDALNYILDELEKGNYDNVLLNFDIYSEKDDRIETEGNFTITNNVVYRSRDDFFVFTKLGITPLSVNIILKKSWIRVMDKEPVESGWIHVHRIIDLISHSEYKESLQISKFCFTLYRERDGWWARNGSLFLNNIKLLKIIKAAKNNTIYAENTIKVIFDEIYNNLHRLIRWGKRTGLKLNFKLLMDTTALFYNKPSYWFFHLPFLLIPSLVFKNDIIRGITNLPRDAIRFIRKFVRIYN